MIKFIIKIVAILQIIQGFLCLTPIWIMVTQGNGVTYLSTLLLLVAIAAAFIGAGILLWRGRKMGITVSFFIQFLQVFVIATATWQYKLLLGPGFTFPIGNVGQYFIDVNLVPLLFCIAIASYSNKLRQRRYTFIS